jgi:predicted ATP-grasp superfamily ATP-dependent carboligase
MYTGGLENHPEVVTAISQARPLWGNDAEVLRAVRDPFRLSQTLGEAGLRFPQLMPSGGSVQTDGSWLVKPRASSGGSGIAVWRGQSLVARFSSGHYFERYVPGQPHAALFFGDGHFAELIGVTRQFVGEPWLHARPFAYCGSIGPVTPSASVLDQLALLGRVLGRSFRLRGLFGVDFVLNEEQVWVVEVNPRYTASVEVLEMGLGQAFLSLVSRHLGGMQIPDSHTAAKLASKYVAKVVYFANKDAVFDLDPAELDSAYADIPRIGTRLQSGQPVLTRFAVGDSVEECLDRLRVAAAWLDRRLQNQ